MPNNSLFVSRNSLFLRNNSLFPNRRVPDQSAVKWRLFRSKGDLGGPESSKFPVIFPVSREFPVEKGSTATASTASAHKCRKHWGFFGLFYELFYELFYASQSVAPSPTAHDYPSEAHRPAHAAPEHLRR
jgi:hypothetical protein